MKKIYLGCCFALIFSITYKSNAKTNLTLIGRAAFPNGLERLPIMITDLLQHDLTINYIPTHQPLIDEIPSKVHSVLLKKDLQAGSISLLTDPVWYPSWPSYKYVPESAIKIAYSMIESSEIPVEWTSYLNSLFTMVIVPDPWLVPVYKKCGVTLPIFVLPIGLYLDDFLKQPLKKKKNKIFTFGMSAACVPGKNQELVIDAFVQLYRSNPHVKLKIHTRGGNLVKHIKDYIDKQQCNNIEFVHKVFTHKQYVAFLKSLDVYVLLSGGEGFSIGPREAMALGIPCIISNNTAHKTICKSKLVTAIKCPILKPAYYEVFGREVGLKFFCKTEDVITAMKLIRKNYIFHLKKSAAMRKWVKRYHYKKLKSKYLNLIKPQEVRLGNQNIIKNNYLETNSKSLYLQYLSLKNQSAQKNQEGSAK